MKNKNKTKGFTLIEMLVVIGIIGVLSTMILVSVSSIRKNSICTRREANVENVRGAVNMYYSIKNTWPDYSDGWTNLVSALSTAGYLSDDVPADDDGDGTNDYSIGTCTSPCVMKLCNTCPVSGREGYEGDTRCLEVK